MTVERWHHEGKGLELRFWGPGLTALLFWGWLLLTGSVFPLLFDRVRWREWRQRLGQVRLGRALHATAVKHRALRLQLQVSPADSDFGVLSSCTPTEGGVGLPSRRPSIRLLPLCWALAVAQGSDEEVGGRRTWKAGLFNRQRLLLGMC